MSGKIRISGNKNSILPCLAACLLTDQEVTLCNVPQISDVGVFSEILKSVGAQVKIHDDVVKVRCEKVRKPLITEELAGKLRASILMVGALVGRVGKVEFFHPGGDIIGRRGIDLHLAGFQSLGCTVRTNDHRYKIVRARDDSRDSKIFLEIATVTGTENLILASVIGGGSTIIKNAAQEPHVVDLCTMLNAMGAKIEGVGTPVLTIRGVNTLKGVEFSIGSDYIELGTYAVAAALTGGEIEVANCKDFDLDPTIWPMVKMGLSIKQDGHTVRISAKKIQAIPKLVTNVWPGFPTDLMSIMIVLATQAKGVSLMHDWVYESRMFFVDKLIAMGANITIADPHRVLIYGPAKLYGRNLESPDIRAGMALVLAALIASGKSTINRAELIERGYENVVDKLISLGAKIERIS